MAKVDFYILETADPAHTALFTCRLTEKIWLQGHTVYIHLPTQTQAVAMDEWLWSFRDTGFIPHDLYPDVADSQAPVRLGCTPPPPAGMAVLINLTLEIPQFYQQYSRIAEVVDARADQRAAGRAKYASYRVAACELVVHNITNV